MKSTSKYLPLVALLLWACSADLSDPQEIVDKAIDAHHADYTGKIISFDFRDRSYSVRRDSNRYIYTRVWEDDSLGFVRDILVNSSKFNRIVTGDTVDVDEAWASKYRSSINSVLYFFQVPYILNDRAANKKLLGRTEIQGQEYYSIEVTFDQEGGGEDYEDRFIYWINVEAFTVDYFAYSYSVEGGGVRFREAINRYQLDGHLFQDYINYEAEISTPLEELPSLWDQGALKELSRIENQNLRIQRLN